MTDEKNRNVVELRMSVYIPGFPDYILNPEELDKEFAELKIVKDKYFQNNKKIREFTMKKELARLKKAVNKTRWDMSPPTVNAYYSPSR